MASSFMSTVVSRLRPGKGKNRHTRSQADNTMHVLVENPSSPSFSSPPPHFPAHKTRAQTKDAKHGSTSPMSTPVVKRCSQSTPSLPTVSKKREGAKRKSPLLASLRKKTRPLSCFAVRPESPTCRRKAFQERDRDTDSRGAKNEAKSGSLEKPRRPLSCIVQPPSPRLTPNEDGWPELQEEQLGATGRQISQSRGGEARQRPRPVSCYVDALPLNRSPPPYTRRLQYLESSRAERVNPYDDLPQQGLPPYTESPCRADAGSRQRMTLSADVSEGLSRLKETCQEKMSPYSSAGQEDRPPYSDPLTGTSEPSKATEMRCNSDYLLYGPETKSLMTSPLNSAALPHSSRSYESAALEYESAALYNKSKGLCHSAEELSYGSTSNAYSSHYTSSSNRHEVRSLYDEVPRQSTPVPSTRLPIQRCSDPRCVLDPCPFQTPLPAPSQGWDRGRYYIPSSDRHNGSGRPVSACFLCEPGPCCVVGGGRGMGREVKGRNRPMSQCYFPGCSLPWFPPVSSPTIIPISNPHPTSIPAPTSHPNSTFPPAIIAKPGSATPFTVSSTPSSSSPATILASSLTSNDEQRFSSISATSERPNYTVANSDETWAAEQRSPYWPRLPQSSPATETGTISLDSAIPGFFSVQSPASTGFIMTAPSSSTSQDSSLITESNSVQTMRGTNHSRDIAITTLDGHIPGTSNRSGAERSPLPVRRAPVPAKNDDTLTPKGCSQDESGSIHDSILSTNDPFECRKSEQCCRNESPSPVQDNLSSVYRYPEHSLDPEQEYQQEKTNAAGGNPQCSLDPAQASPNPVEGNLNPSQRSSNSGQASLSHTEGCLVPAQGSPKLAQGNPSLTHGSPKLVQGHLNLSHESPSPAQDSPTLAQGSPIPAKRNPCSPVPPKRNPVPAKRKAAPRPMSTCLTSSTHEGWAASSGVDQIPPAIPPPRQSALKKYRSADCLDRMEELDNLAVSPPAAKPVSHFFAERDSEGYDPTQKQARTKGRDEIFISAEMLNKLGQPHSRGRQPRLRPASCVLASSADESGYLSNGTLGGSCWLSRLSASTGDMLNAMGGLSASTGYMMDAEELAADDELSFERSNSLRKAWSLCSLLRHDSIQDRSFHVMRRRRQRMKDRRHISARDDNHPRSSSTETDDGVDAKREHSASSLQVVKDGESATFAGIPLDKGDRTGVSIATRLPSANLKAWQVRLRRRYMMRRGRSVERGSPPRMETLV